MHKIDIFNLLSIDLRPVSIDSACTLQSCQRFQFMKGKKCLVKSGKDTSPESIRHLKTSYSSVYPQHPFCTRKTHEFRAKDFVARSTGSFERSEMQISYLKLRFS